MKLQHFAGVIRNTNSCSAECKKGHLFTPGKGNRHVSNRNLSVV